MLSWKRMLYVVLIVTAVSCIFVLYNFNEERGRHIQTMNMQEQERSFTDSRKLSDKEKPKVRIIGKSDEMIYQNIRQNTRQIFENLHYLIAQDTEPDMGKVNIDELVVFCDAVISDSTDLVKLEEFISKGGKVILAGGLPEGNEDAYLWPLLGIREKSVRENYNKFRFEKALLPIQAREMVYGEYNMSTWLSVDSEADVYIRDVDSNVPVLYTCNYGKGKICLFNGTFLADMQCAGLLTGAVGALEEEMIYPVMGTKTVFLDNFPMITFINDKLCMKMYGCSTESFVRDVVWPYLQGMSLRTQTPYTSSILAVASSKESFPEINDSLFTTIGKSALQYGGELIYAANCKEDEGFCFNDKFIEEFSQVFTNYEIRGLAVQSGQLSEGMLDIPGSEIIAVRTSLKETGGGFSCDKNYLEFPAATGGNSMEDGNLLAVSSILGAYGMVSHVFDVNTLIAKDDETASWDQDRKQIGLFETEILKKAPWLEGRILSQTGDDIRSYLNLEYVWRKEGHTIELDCSNMALGQAFFFRTKGRIKKAQGLSYEEAGNGYYLLRVNQDHAVITMEEE